MIDQRIRTTVANGYIHEKLKNPVVCVIGLGYVGLPLASEFCSHYKVIGFDINEHRVEELNRHNSIHNFQISSNPDLIAQADFIVITVPTPITESKEPDLSYVTYAARTISQNMKHDCTVILESTVYPGVTEDILKPILEESGLQCGKDFRLAYSPERINPGDEIHSLYNVVKVVSGMDEDTTELVSQFYSKVCKEVYKAVNIKTAEAAKVIENIQRDINIALVNEFSLIFDKIGLNTRDVLDAASTKWNFYRCFPGLVGGHCIPVDPYYLVYKAKELGYNPQAILMGRNINDYMSIHVAQLAIKGLNQTGKVIKGSKVLIMGLAYKENVPDTRETPSKEVIKELNNYGVNVYGYDPLLNNIEKEFHIEEVPNFECLTDIDCVILNANHNVFRQITLSDLKTIMNNDPLMIDVHRYFDETAAKELGFYYKSL
ncbi:nucleotide sugar dehydrogenase [Chloroflexota bacterium]